MPIKLNITNAARYAQVDPEFVTKLKEIWKGRWSRLNEEIKVQHPRYREMKARANAPVMSRLKALCTNQQALDKELTRLRGLPYEHFYIRRYNGEDWMVGLTQPIVMSDDLRRYQAPRYFVYIPSDVTSRGTDARFHFVPEGYEMTVARHPHHRVKDVWYDNNGCQVNLSQVTIKDTLDYIPSTCWGSFGTIATSCIQSGDIVDLYRNLGIYLTRVNQNSLLTRPFSACHFLVDIGPAVEEKHAITKHTKIYDR